jgi:hypothetical protein
MSLKKLKQAVLQLPPEEFEAFRRWIADYDMMLWDQQIEKDSAEVRLDGLIEDAFKDYRNAHA